MAIKQYESDHGIPPPGSGRGSKELAIALQKHGPKGRPYFEFLDGVLKEQGDIVNPVHAGSIGKESIIYYRNNILPGGTPNPPHGNTKGVDLWAQDAEGRPDGIRNW